MTEEKKLLFVACDYRNNRTILRLVKKWEAVTHILIECPKYLTERAMLLAETSKTHEIEIQNFLLSPRVSDQKAV